MVGLDAARSNPRFSVSRVDIDRPGSTYTLDTLHDIRAHYGDDVDLFFITGADALSQILTWHGVLELFETRILPFDTDAARHYAALAVQARAAGKGFPTPDGYIAAIAASRGFTVASRDTTAFAAAGLAVIDPWTTALP